MDVQIKPAYAIIGHILRAVIILLLMIVFAIGVYAFVLDHRWNIKLHAKELTDYEKFFVTQDLVFSCIYEDENAKNRQDEEFSNSLNSSELPSLILFSKNFDKLLSREITLQLFTIILTILLILILIIHIIYRLGFKSLYKPLWDFYVHLFSGFIVLMLFGLYTYSLTIINTNYRDMGNLIRKSVISITTLADTEYLQDTYHVCQLKNLNSDHWFKFKGQIKERGICHAELEKLIADLMLLLDLLLIICFLFFYYFFLRERTRVDDIAEGDEEDEEEEIMAKKGSRTADIVILKNNRLEDELDLPIELTQEHFDKAGLPPEGEKRKSRRKRRREKEEEETGSSHLSSSPSRRRLKNNSL